MNGFVELEWSDWWDKFNPITNKQNPSMDQIFETFGKDYETVQFCMAFFPLHVWTVMEGDDDIFIGNGMHYVNRLHYFITEVPAVENVQYEIV